MEESINKLQKSRFMYTTHGSGICDCCEEDKQPVLLLVTSGATISICLDCLPSTMHDMIMTSLHMVQLGGGTAKQES